MTEKTAKDRGSTGISTEETGGAAPSVEAWLAERKAAGLQIDPATAEVAWWYAPTSDPYGVYPALPEQIGHIGREYFARAPGSDMWISCRDLPDATRDALWAKHSSKLAFQAGLSFATETACRPARQLHSSPLVYSISEACAVVGIRRTTLYKVIRTGDLRAIKIGRRTFISASDLQRWLVRRPAIGPKRSTSHASPNTQATVHCRT